MPLSEIIKCVLSLFYFGQARWPLAALGAISPTQEQQHARAAECGHSMAARPPGLLLRFLYAAAANIMGLRPAYRLRAGFALFQRAARAHGHRACRARWPGMTA